MARDYVTKRHASENPGVVDGLAAEFSAVRAPLELHIDALEAALRKFVAYANQTILADVPLSEEQAVLLDAHLHAAAVLAGKPSPPAMDAIVVLRDRLFSALAYVADIVGELEDGIPHEDSVEFVCRSGEVVRATDALDMTDRSKPGWELDAESRRAALAAQGIR